MLVVSLNCFVYVLVVARMHLHTHTCRVLTVAAAVATTATAFAARWAGTVEDRRVYMHANQTGGFTLDILPGPSSPHSDSLTTYVIT